MSRGLVSDLRQSLKHYEFWTYSSWLDIVVRYRRTQLGLLWVLLAFAFFVVLMGTKYAYLMNVDPQVFIPYMAVGYMVWRFLVTVLNDAVGTFARHSSYIMDGRSRLTDYLLRSLATAAFSLFFAVFVLIFVLWWSQKTQVVSLLSIFITFPLVVINIMWVSVCVGLVGARHRDVHELIGTVLMVGFLLTPIIWDMSRFPAGTMRGELTRLNPAFHLIEIVRAPILGSMPETNSIIWVCVMAVLGWLLASVMYRRYARFVPLWVV